MLKITLKKIAAWSSNLTKEKMFVLTLNLEDVVIQELMMQVDILIKALTATILYSTLRNTTVLLERDFLDYFCSTSVIYYLIYFTSSQRLLKTWPFWYLQFSS